jgi:hypothetical protein
MTAADDATAIVLVNWNNWRDVAECLDSLLAQDTHAIHVFVVDNGSSDGSVAALQGWCAAPARLPGWRELPGVSRLTDSAPARPVAVRLAAGSPRDLPAAAPDCRVTIVDTGTNTGFAGGCNAGIHAAGSRHFAHFWMLNPDTVVQRNTLAALLRRAAEEPRPGIVGSTLRYYDRPGIVQACGGAAMDPGTVEGRHVGDGLEIERLPAAREGVERQLAYVMGASMLVSREFLRDIGPMQEDYFLYFEEADWAARSRGRYALAWAPDSHLFHKSGTSSSRVVRVFATRLYYRNRLRFAGRFFPERLAATRRRLWIEFAKSLAKCEWRRAMIIGETLRDGDALVAGVARAG